MSAATKVAKADEPAPLNLYQRIREVMREVEYLNKDKQVGDGGYSYKAVSEESVTGTVREKMIKHGLVMFPVAQVHKHEELPRMDKYGKASILSFTTVDVTYKLANVDDMTQFELIASSGTGVDPQDKGVGKAMTYAYKYALLRTFGIPTGNDPDMVHNDELERNAPAAAPMPLAPESRRLIERLVTHELITPEDREKTLANLDTLNHETGKKTINVLTKRIQDQGGEV